MSITGTLILYLGTAFFTAVLTHFAMKHTAALRLFFASAAILLPSLLAGARYDVGTDWGPVYYAQYTLIKGSPDYKSRFEWGYWAINKIAAFAGLNFAFVMFFAAFITMLFVFLALEQYKEVIHPGAGMFTYMLLYYTMSFNLVRQLMAASILLFAVKYIVDKRPVRYTLLVLLAASFHVSAIIFLLFYLIRFVLSTDSPKLLRLAFLAASLLVTLNFNSIFRPILERFAVTRYYAGYLEGNIVFNLTVGFFIRLIPFIVPLIFLAKKTKQNPYIFQTQILLILGFFLRFLAYMERFSADRLAIYFLIFLTVWMGYVWKQKGLLPVKISAMLTICVIFYYDYFIMRSAEIVPFRFVDFTAGI